MPEPTQPDSFDPWEFAHDRGTIASLPPKARRICRHGKVQIACGWRDCREEGFAMVFPQPDAPKPLSVSVDDMLALADTARAWANVKKVYTP